LLNEEVLLNNKQLVVVKSISKSYGIPGLRLGIMGNADQKLIDSIRKDISIWNINMEQKSGELGYGIIPEFQGNGLMKEALLSVLKYGFDVMNLRCQEAYTEENNIRTIKLLEKCNFIEVNRVIEEGYFNNRVYRMVVYRLENKVMNMEPR
jgi:ribosomal-protein-alanine N-acetyltransferase